jgi:hypothetical protein
MIITVAAAAARRYRRTPMHDQCEFAVVRRCREESYNLTAADQGRRLIVEWTAQLPQAARPPTPAAPTDA